MNLHMCAKFGANRPSRLVAFPECVLRFGRLFAAVRADSGAGTNFQQGGQAWCVTQPFQAGGVGAL